MSSDARVRMSEDGGWQWTGNHDGPCVEGMQPSDHEQPAPLAEKLVELEACLGGHPLRWEFDSHLLPEIRMRGWCA